MRRRTRSSMAASYDGAVDENDIDPLQIAQPISRTSMSSTSTTHESSSYSTPATSAVTTPAPVKDELSAYVDLSTFSLVGYFFGFHGIKFSHFSAN